MRYAIIFGIIFALILVLSFVSFNKQGFVLSVQKEMVGDSQIDDNQVFEDCGMPCRMPEDPAQTLDYIGIYDANGNCVNVYDYVSQEMCCRDEDCPIGKICKSGRCE